MRTLVRRIDPHASVTLMPTHRRLRFRQVGRHWYGRVFALPLALLMRAAMFARFMPYLVVRITTDAASDES